MNQSNAKPSINENKDIQKLIQEMQEKYAGSSLTTALLRERAADLEREEADIRYWGMVFRRNKEKRNDAKSQH